MSIPMVDLKAQYASIRDEIDGAVRRVIENAQFIGGPEVEAFEQEMGGYCGAAFAVGVASGTEALQLALLACGIKPGDEVVTPPFTFIATAEAITQCGAVPVFADIDPLTYNLDPRLIEEKITPRTRCIMPVHLYGHPADMGPIMEIAAKHRLKVIEDCAQALGAAYTFPVSQSKSPRKVGTFGDAGCLSFFPSKVLGAYGDGGMVVTGDAAVADNLKMLRNHGAKQKYYHLVPGFNSRLDGLQAAVLRVKLRHLKDWIEGRRRVAALYAKYLGKISYVTVPCEAQGSRHCYNYYTVRLKAGTDRGALQKSLSAQGISSMVYYPVSLHLQAVYAAQGGKKGDFPVSEKAQDEVLSLPIYPEMTEQQVVQVAEAIREATR
ncbi:MAG: DegT/DnrJ/EryC1/StrS family aminotransferase [Dehalococcoidia bacterium]|nr:DegT/DnrJ/EryC1/StrS family aminotransferase [Dehalococcoidia bacterium]